MSIYIMGSSATKLTGPRHLLGDERDAWITDPLVDWTLEGRTLAAYSWNLVQTDPYAAGLLEARVSLILGERGLLFKSKYQEDENSSTTQRELIQRRKINKLVASYDNAVNAGAKRSRFDVETTLAISRVVAGESFAVRTWKPNRRYTPWATAWRALDPMRVGNPNGFVNWQRVIADRENKLPAMPAGHVIWEGIELDKERDPAALWVRTASKTMGEPDTFQRIEWYSTTGRVNVIHDFKKLRPEQLRGFSEFTPIFRSAKHLKGTAEAHVVGKRAQACHPLFIKSTDPTVAQNFSKSEDALNPKTKLSVGMIGFLGDDGDVITPNYSYQGSDYQMHVETELRAMASAWGLAWQWVLAHVKGVSMASGRIALDRVEATGGKWRKSHTTNVTSVIDQSYLDEAIARGWLDVSLEAALMSRYLPPRRMSLDRNKETNALETQARMGRDLTGIFAELNLDFEESILERAENERFMKQHNVSIELVIQAIRDSATSRTDAEHDDIEDDEDDEDDEEKEEDENED